MPNNAFSGVQFALFDWLDESGRDVGDTYAERLRMVELADEAGFHCYHLAEHHGSELSTVPSPNLFLSAVAQRTHRIRLGPLGYVLPTYIPLRLLEEICMLDQLSEGRLDVGVGRGSSEFETAVYGIRPEATRAVFQEALTVILQGLSTGEIDYHGTYFQYDHVTTRLRTRQRPYPPLWYPTSNAASVPWIGSQGLNTIFSLNVTPSIEKITEMMQAYREALAAHRDDADRINAHVAEPRCGLAALVHVADTDERALDQARASYARFMHNFTHRYVLRGEGAKYAGRENFDREIGEGKMLVGSPDTVRRKLDEYLQRCGANYFMGGFFFGGFPLDQGLRSLELFAQEVIPGLTAAPVS